MNLALESIYRAIDESTQRMPKIVRERCFVCQGRGAIERRTRDGIALDYCRCCASNGWIAREAA
jgi:hypothetical protein